MTTIEELIRELNELKDACVEDENNYRENYDKHELVTYEARTLADNFSYRADLIQRTLDVLNDTLSES